MRGAARGPDTRAPAGRSDQRGPGDATRRRGRTTTPHDMFAERLLAVLSGSRPVHWMLGHTIGDEYDQLIALAPAAPLRTGTSHPVVRSCRGIPLRPGVVEACASIETGERVRAMAFRIERGDDLRWRCAAVELGGDLVPA
ncbi:hypothetical protein B1H18_31040 [Streptomyces tsukubensis]|uniref:Uncharacterized protein n=1 Tax=Streptomyces tsukubensis TaxID=83656 RepID=A0A1V4A153_9ACTN|nr:hypothetical protein B1H18_31040 [Streptomyces tsukubensis]